MGQDPDCVAKRIGGAVAACWYEPRFILSGCGQERRTRPTIRPDAIWTANAATLLLGSCCERK